MLKRMRKSHSFPSIPNPHYEENENGVTTNPINIPQSDTNYYSIEPQSSSYNSPPHPEARRPFVNQNPHEHEHEQAVGDHFLAAVLNSTAVESQKIDVDAPSDSEFETSAATRIFLYQNALKGEWEYVELLIDGCPYYIRSPITRNKETILHIAAGAKQTEFVEKLVDRMTSADMTLQNKYGNTALCFAAASGVVRIAQVMVAKNKLLPLIRGFNNIVTPLFIAVSYKCAEMVSYLWSITDLDQLRLQEKIELLIATIHSDFYDISLWLLQRYPHLAVVKDMNGETALHVMARKPSAMDVTKTLTIWEKYKSWICGKVVTKTVAHELVNLLWTNVQRSLREEEMLEFIKHPTRLLNDAASAGNVEFLIELIRKYPDIIWEDDDDGKSIFHVAVENRLENVFNLINEIGRLNEFTAKYRTFKGRNYNILHLAGNLPAPNHLNRVSVAALQMQRELLWFKEVEKIVLPSQLETKSNVLPSQLKTKSNYPEVPKLTPRQLFTQEHKNLRKDGEEWMKSTANSCMLVATLISTVVFAAAFTVPGGSDDIEGTPIFQQKFWFTVFVMSDAVALFASSTSILMFMSILTSRYAEEDFLHSLPSRLLFGLATLFLSIVCMVVAFSATFFMLYHKADICIPTVVSAMAIVPVICFCALQFKLWVDIFNSTYSSRFLFKPRQQKLF